MEALAVEILNFQIKHSYIHFLPVCPIRGRGGLKPIPAA